MNRGKKRAAALWRNYQRRTMIEYVAKEKDFKKEVVDLLFSDALDVFELSDNEVTVKLCAEKYSRFTACLRAIAHPTIPAGIPVPSHLFNLTNLISDFQHAVN